MMDIPTATKQLEAEWSFVELTGFFGKMSYTFDEEGFERVKKILDSIELPQEEAFDRRFVEITWFIPTFMHWKRKAWIQDGKNTQKLDEAINFFEGRLTTILGLP
jgi:hypothetical protein